MLSFSQCAEVGTRILQKNPKAVINYKGAPGLGKSACSLLVGENLGLPDDRVEVVHVNNHDVVDFTGVPSIRNGMTVFNPSEMFYKFRTGTGAGLIILEELAQSTVHHQTWAAGFIYDRKTPTFELDPMVSIICTGNRAEDRSGAKPLLAHLNDRMYHFEMVTSLDDWCAHAMSIGVNPMLIAFLRLRPDLLNNFRPDQVSNGTQRSWVMLNADVPLDLPTNLYLAACEGKVGEGNAAEWVAAKDMMHKMPNIDAIRLKPETTEVPTEPAVRFAVATALSMSATDTSFARDMIYVNRLPKEFQMVYVTDTLRLNPDLAQTADFRTWAIANKDIFLGSN